MHPIAAILVALGFVSLSLIAGYYLSFAIVISPVIQCVDVGCPIIHSFYAWPITSVILLVAIVFVYRRWR